MNKKIIVSYVVIAAFFLILAIVYINKNSYNSLRQQEAMKEFIMENPQLIVESLQKWQQDSAVMAQQQSQEKASQMFATLINDTDLPKLGADNADIKIVAIFDYVCGYCKMMSAQVRPLIENGKVQVTLMDLPTMSLKSKMLAQVALAVYQLKPEAYEAIHYKFFNAKGLDNMEDILKITDEYKLDRKAVKELSESPKIANIIEKNMGYATAMAIAATPIYIIEGEMFTGAIPQSKFEEIIEKHIAAKQQ